MQALITSCFFSAVITSNSHLIRSTCIYFDSQNSAIENELAEIVGLAFGVIIVSLETLDNMFSMTR